MKLVRLEVILLALLSALPLTANAQLSLSLERVASGLAGPIFVTHAPGDADRLFICQRAGAIRILNLNTGNLNGANFMTVPSVNTSFEGGLLGLAFHPDYENNGFFYVNYTISAGGTFRTRIARFTATTDDTANSGSLQIVLEVNQPQQNHNGGWIGFDDNGLLYIATGDGGGGNDSGTGHTAVTGNSQDITGNLLGKMLRINVDGDDFPADPNRNYAIPPNNPFVGVTGDDEIFLYGLRNPFRCSFDRDTDNLYIGDVGQGAREEIDVIPAGHKGNVNMGWRLREGTIQTPGVGGARPADNVDPIYDYPRTGLFGGRSVTGGVVYRGPITALNGNYFFSDYETDNFWSLRYDGSDPSTFNGSNFTSLTRWNGAITTDIGSLNDAVCFGEDLAGNVYIADLGGEVFKIADGNLTTPGTLDLFFASPEGDLESGTLKDLVASDDNVVVFRADPANQGQPSIRVEFFGSVPDSSPSTLIFNFESRVSTPNVTQTTEIYNFLTSMYEVFDTRDASATADEAYTVEIGNPNVYVNVTGTVRTRVTLTSTGPVVGFPWAFLIDRAGWDIIE